MRGCLYVIGLAAVLVVVVAFVGLRPVAAGVIHAGVVASGLQSDDLRVTVDADPPTELLGFHADAVRILATDATWREARIARVDIRLADVALLGREADSVRGRLDDVRIAHDDTDGTDGGRRGELRIGRVDLRAEGGRAVVATAAIDAGSMEEHIAARIREQSGLDPGAVRLEAPDTLSITVLGLRVGGRLAIAEDGSLVLRIASDVLADLVLVDAEDAPIRFSTVRVAGRTLELVGELDVAGF